MAHKASKHRLPASPYRSPAIRAGDAAAVVLQDIYAGRGFGTHQIISNWPAIVGDELAQLTAPEKLTWSNPPTAARDDPNGQSAILHIRVDGPLAIEVQHTAGQIIERVNRYLGAPLVQSLRILQAPVAGPQLPAQRDRVMASKQGEIDEPEDALEAALVRLGAAIGQK
jgi:hypothetical protein